MNRQPIEELAREALRLWSEFERVLSDLRAVVNSESLRSERKKSDALAKSIHALESVGVPVPAELLQQQREIENRINAIQLAEQVIGQIAKKPSIDPTRVTGWDKPEHTSQATRVGQGITLAAILHHGLLPDGQEVIHEEKRSGTVRRGWLRSPGVIEVDIDGELLTFPNPSSAGCAAGRKQTCDGWFYWSVATHTGLVPLDHYRSRLQEMIRGA